MRKLLRRLWYVFHRRRAHDDLAEELAFHRDMTERELQAQGAEPEQAAFAARRALGNSTLAHDQVHDVWVPSSLQGIGHDFRLAVRTLVGTPVVSLVAVLSLALGIGANTAIFSLIDGLLLRMLPVRDPARLVLLSGDVEGENSYWTYQVWQAIARRSQIFDGTLAWSDARLNLARGGETRYINGLLVSGSFFDLLGVPALIGRTLARADDMPRGGNDGPVAVISYDFWQRHFGGAPTAIGASLLIHRIPFTVVGVTRRDFFGLDVGRAFDLAVPIEARDVIEDRNNAPGPSGPLVQIVGRLRHGDTIESATAALRGIQPQIRQATLPEGWPKPFLDRYLKAAFTLRPAATGTSLLRRRFSRPLLAIMVIVALVLLVASANLANLALARATARRRELGVQLALGASRSRLVRQLLGESLLLAGAGAALGLLLASWIARLLVQQLSTTVRSIGAAASTGRAFVDVSIDGRVLVFTMALTVITVLVFGVLPALQTSRVAPLDALINRGNGAWHRRGLGARDVFIVAQVAISLAVVVAAGLFTRTLTALETRHLGFDREDVLVATIDAQSVVDPARRQALYTNVVDAVRQVPGVAEAALSSVPPVLNGPVPGQSIQAISGEPPLPPRGAFSAMNLISPGWFGTLGIPLVAGRDVSRDDRLDTPPVVVVNEMFARTLLHGANPIGRTLTLALPGPPSPPVEIVGVVSDTVYGAVRAEVEPTIFLPIAQRGPVWWRFLAPVDLSIRSTADRPEPLAKSVAAAIGAVNPDLALTFHPLTDYVNDSVVQERLIARLSGSFAVLTLLLAAIGLYGVLAYAVAGRRMEIGVRIALGAPSESIVRVVLGRVFMLLTVGVVIGAVVSLWASSFVVSLLYDVQPRDPTSFGGAVVVLAGVAFLASWVPARRAARIDPMRVLRAE